MWALVQKLGSLSTQLYSIPMNSILDDNFFFYQDNPMKILWAVVKSHLCLSNNLIVQLNETIAIEYC